MFVQELIDAHRCPKRSYGLAAEYDYQLLTAWGVKPTANAAAAIDVLDAIRSGRHPNHIRMLVRKANNGIRYNYKREF